VDVAEIGVVVGESIAGESVEIGFFGEEGEGGDHFGDVVRLGAERQGVDGIVPHLVFEGADAELTPVGENHSIHAGAFGWGAGLKEREVVLEEGVEIAGGFVFEEGDA
jgi:hypothetical protein